MKKKIILLLALLLAFSLTACGLRETAQPTVERSIPVQAQETGQSAVPESKPESQSRLETETKPETDPEPEIEAEPEAEDELLPEDGSYTGKEEVALYLHQYGHLPDNFITKREAEALGWPGGNLEPYAPGKCIGGSRFGNYEGRLPEKKGRTYTECDIDTLGKRSRGAKRLVFSNDGLIYYTEDHYETFELLYGEE